MLSAGRLRPWVPHGSEEERVCNSGVMAALADHPVTNLRPVQGAPAARNSLQQALFTCLILLIIQQALLALHIHLSSLSHYTDPIIIIAIHREGK